MHPTTLVGLVLALASLGPGCVFLGGHQDADLQHTVQSFRGGPTTLVLTLQQGDVVQATRSYELPPNATLQPPPIPVPYGDYRIVASADGITAGLDHWLDSETKGLTIFVGDEEIRLLALG